MPVTLRYLYPSTNEVSVEYQGIVKQALFIICDAVITCIRKQLQHSNLVLRIWFPMNSVLGQMRGLFVNAVHVVINFDFTTQTYFCVLMLGK